MRYLEDFNTGDRFDTGSYLVTPEEIVDFAKTYDPQPFHIDEDAARKSLLGGLAASGWHTSAISMRLHCESWLKGVAGLGSPGIIETKWLRPVMKDYSVRLNVHLLSVRESSSRPGMGILQHETTMLNQDDAVLMIMRGITLVATRSAPENFSVYDGKALAAAPLWQRPEYVLQSPDDAADGEGILTGWLDDMTVGLTVELGSHQFTEEEIIAFASKWDPQPFHVDRHAARSGPFGGLIASGWHTGAAGMRQHVFTRQTYLAEGQRRGLPETPRGPSPGFRDMKWLEPVFAGDEIHYYMTTESWRPVSRKGWGVMVTHFEGINQHGRKVYEYYSSGMWPVRQD